jgi:periplasmic copper chaperone A
VPEGLFIQSKEPSVKPLLTAVIAAFVASSAFAHDTIVGNFQIIHAAIPAPISTAKSAAGYMAISNEGATEDTLIGVEVDFAAKAMLHTTEFGANGVARMMHVPALTIPAEDTVVLEPGGYHIMLMGLNKPLNLGDMLPATLIFEHAGRVPFEFMVDPADGSVDHSTMDHSAMTAPQTSASIGDDLAAIEGLLKAQFDTPDAPLTVAPITLSGDAAIAGWQQDGRAGRAFLRRDAQGWFIELCAGASLLLPATLQSMGLGRADATDLLTRVQAAEAALGPETTAAFDTFSGTLLIGRNGQ